MSKTRDIDIQIVIEGPLESVYQAWLKPAILERWLARGARVEPALGGAYELFWDPKDPSKNCTVGCRITGLVPNREISFSWKGPEEHAEVMGDKTQVFVRLEACEGGTLLRFVHTGWGAGERWEKARAWQAAAWQEAIENLKNLLENTEKITHNLSMN